MTNKNHIEVLREMAANTGDSADLNLRDAEANAIERALASSADFDQPVFEALLSNPAELDLTPREREAVLWLYLVCRRHARLVARMAKQTA